MSKRRIRFTKMNMAKFISHLDLMRCFTRAINRSGLPVVFSQGFNPHMKMTFALPLPVGVSGLREAADIAFEDGIDDDEIKKRLNENLPPDIKVTEVGDVGAKASDIVCAEYGVTLSAGNSIDLNSIKDFFGRDEVIVMKLTKKKTEKPINIMEYIRAWELEESDSESIKLRLVLDAGGERNLKPDVVVTELAKACPGIDADSSDIFRREIFCRTQEKDGVLERFY
ncbi:MAG: TIGR03936 family radical SAM-associated protein [Monoglobaceae bacterium]